MKPRNAILSLSVVAAGLVSGVAVGAQSSGRLIAWGRMVVPYLEPGTRFTDVACGDGHTLALEADGTVVAWGNNFYGQCLPPTNLSNVMAVAAGGSGSFSLALRDDGTVVAWG
ncbi:MAG: hypothetical protein HYZ36_05155, partial [Pedosphaera parvula]|nr:hypothetical protein [Pedosphaera parvula]